MTDTDTRRAPTVQTAENDLHNLDPVRGVHIRSADGSYWIIRPDQEHPDRLEVTLIVGSGPYGGTDVSIRPQASNIVTLASVRG